MAFKSKSSSLMFIIAILLFLVIEEASGNCNNVEKCLHAKEATTISNKSRKVRAMLSGLSAATKIENGEKLEKRKLRKTPSGPDPYHHVGEGPKPAN